MEYRHKRRWLKWTAVLLLAATLFALLPSCAVYGEGAFVLAADRYQILPNGKDTVRLQCTTLDGEEIPLEDVKIYVNGSPRPGAITSRRKTELQIVANYNGQFSNVITVTAGYASDLPIVVIDTNGHSIPESKADGEITATFTLYEPGVDGVTVVGSNATATTACEIHVRGQSSADFPKKQYKLEFVKEDGTNNNLSLLGMPRENDWIINGSYADRTLLHNWFAYTVGAELSFAYTPRVQFCEVYITQDAGNIQNEDYKGVFLLMESIKADDDRVNITKGDSTTDPEQMGFIFAKDKQEKLTAENVLSTTYYNYELVYPKPDNISDEQRDYLVARIQQFEDVLYSENFTDPETGWRAYMHETEYIDLILLTEYMKNVDGVRLSSYFYFDKDGKITSGPIWDWDISCGIANYGDEWDDYRWFVCLDTEKRGTDDYPWLDRLLQDEAFCDRLVERYRELRATVLSDERTQQRIDEAYAEIYAAAQRNASRWPEQFDGVTAVDMNAQYPTSYEEAVNAMKIFLHQRGEWLDKWIGLVNGEITKES